jgi:MoaA/NifB/PqqE/SkfB family radical SAM enzyme
MNKINKSEAHGLLGEMPNALRELWIEIPGDCHLNCRYCLAFENKNDFKFVDGARIDQRDNLLTIESYFKILEEFKEKFPLSEKEIANGVKKQIAIPAAGEPFFTERLRNYIYPLLNFCEKNDIIISVFSTGDLINEEDIERLKPLRNLRLLIKVNSFTEQVQDKLAGKKKYAQARNHSLNRLIEEGFNDGRLGIVTSLIKQNATEAEELLRFARRNNLTFDMDLVISRGKGDKCHCQMESREDILRIVDDLRAIDEKDYNRSWLPSPTYIGSKPCTRFSYHLYIQNNGNVSPCIGSTQIIYGNAKDSSLENIWESKLSKTVRERMSNIKGSCVKCKNFDSSCFSCLGRSTIDLSESLNNGYLNTVGCNIFGPVK